MVSVNDVPAGELIMHIAADFKQRIPKPAFVDFVKTGAHVERAPQNRDWYYIRMASILYRVFKDGPVGTGSLRTYYGGRKNRGVRPHKFVKAGGKIIRTCLQTLEREGLIIKAKKGRVISAKGQSYLTKKAREVYEILKTTPKKERPVKGLKVEAPKTEKFEIEKKKKAEKTKEKEKKKGEERRKEKEPVTPEWKI